MNYKRDNLEIAIKDFYKSVDPCYGRHLAQQACYEFFQSHYNTDDDTAKDFITLHLVTYLANWGMMRGHSFLANKTYQFSRPVVDYLCEEQKRIDRGEPSSLSEVKANIRARYMKDSEGNTLSFLKDGELKPIPKASDILVSKIILGTLGTAPAYDSIFMQGCKKIGISPKFNEAGLKQIEKFIEDNKEAIDTISSEYKCIPMRVVDIYIWQVGVGKVK